MRARIFKRGSVIAALAVATVLPMLISPATASAGGDTSGSHVVSNTKTGDRKVTISVFSPAMDRNIPLEVILPQTTANPARRSTCSTVQAAAKTRRPGNARPTS